MNLKQCLLVSITIGSFGPNSFAADLEPPLAQLTIGLRGVKVKLENKRSKIDDQNVVAVNKSSVVTMPTTEGYFGFLLDRYSLTYFPFDDKAQSVVLGYSISNGVELGSSFQYNRNKTRENNHETRVFELGPYINYAGSLGQFGMSQNLALTFGQSQDAFGDDKLGTIKTESQGIGYSLSLTSNLVRNMAMNFGFSLRYSINEESTESPTTVRSKRMDLTKSLNFNLFGLKYRL